MSAASTTARQVRVIFETERMAHSTELRRLRRATEWLYYATLFTMHDRYRSRRDVWLHWAQMGFGTGIQVGPSDVERADRVHVVTDSRGKTLSFLVTPGAVDVVDTWLSVLREIEQVRPGIRADADDQRASALQDDEIIAKLLVEPVAAVCAELPAFERDRIEHALRTSLAALSYPTIVDTTIDEIART